MAKKNVQLGDLIKWNDYVGKATADALQEIYSHAAEMSKTVRTWYWQSIKAKKNSSMGIRFISLILLLGGTVLPIMAGLFSEPEIRLQYTQFGVIIIAIAGLLQFADRVFGWSTGWLRYMTTVMAMEDKTRKFELDWANYMISKTDEITDKDRVPLFNLAKQLEDDISKLQSDETDKWATEFSNSVTLLSEQIKSQREIAEKASDAARLAVSTKQQADEVKEKAQKPGAIELKIIHTALPSPINVAIDSETEDSFMGSIWSKNGVLPGLHVVRVTTVAKTPMTIMKSVEVPAGGIANLEINLP